MRVISGLYKGRILDGFDIEGTRPTQDRVKESLFGSIQDYLEDSIVLDLFAGSGNLGIEALSNYAKECYFVDNNKIAINTINSNLNKIGISSNVLNKDFKEALEYFKDNNIRFDLVFLDPPYKDDYIDYIVEYLLNNNLSKMDVKSSVLNKDFKDALDYFKSNNIKFDLVFLDPPYKDDYIDYTIDFLLNNKLLNDKAIIVSEFESNIKTDYEELKIKKEKKFGYKKIVIFKKI